MPKSKKTILVIEDELPLLEAIQRKLESAGFAVLTAQNTEAAMAKLQRGPKADLIWLDHYIFGKEPGLLFVAELKNPHFCGFQCLRSGKEAGLYEFGGRQILHQGRFQA